MKTIPHSETRDPLGIRFDILSYEFLWTASFFVLKLLKSETYAHNGNMLSTYISFLRVVYSLLSFKGGKYNMYSCWIGRKITGRAKTVSNLMWRRVWHGSSWWRECALLFTKCTICVRRRRVRERKRGRKNEWTFEWRPDMAACNAWQLRTMQGYEWACRCIHKRNLVACWSFSFSIKWHITDKEI